MIKNELNIVNLQTSIINKFQYVASVGSEKQHQQAAKVLLTTQTIQQDIV